MCAFPHPPPLSCRQGVCTCVCVHACERACLCVGLTHLHHVVEGYAYACVSVHVSVRACVWDPPASIMFSRYVCVCVPLHVSVRACVWDPPTSIMLSRGMPMCVCQCM